MKYAQWFTKKEDLLKEMYLKDSGYRINPEWTSEGMGYVCEINLPIGVYQFMHQVASSIEIADKVVIRETLLIQIKELGYESDDIN